MSVAETVAVSDHPPKTEASLQKESRFLTEDQIFTFPSALVSCRSSSITSSLSSVLSTTSALNTPIASYGVPYPPPSSESLATSLSSLDKILPINLKSETCEPMAGGITTLPSAFSISPNPFVNSLTSPFLHHNLFLPHPLASPVFDNAVHLSNSWKLLDAYTRLSGSDTPSRGLPLPTPLFGDLLPSPFGSLVMPNAASGSSSATPAVSPTIDIVQHAIKEEEAEPHTTVASERRPPQAEASETRGINPPDATPTGSEYKVRWGEHAQRMCEHIAASHGDARTTDVLLVGSDGASVPVHSFVMACASPLLRRLLQDAKTDQPAVVMLPGSSAPTLEAIVSVCYRGSICINKALVPNVLKIAQALEITQLRFDDTMSSAFGSTHHHSKSTDSSPSSPKMKAPLPILPKPSYASPSPPAVFTFTPPIPQRSPPPYSTALASCILARTSGKRRPLTPDLSHSEQRAKKVKTGATFLPAEAHPSLPFSPVTPSKATGMKSLSQNASPSPLPASPFSSSAQGGPSSVVRIVPDIVGMGSTSSRVLLWKFLLQLLHDNRFCPVYIRWLDRSNGVFRIMESDMVAQLWGLARKNSNMNYEKMSRGMRTYYKRGILYHIDGTKLIYKFNTSDNEVQQHMRYFEVTQQPDDASSDGSMSTPGSASADSFQAGNCSDAVETSLAPLSLENPSDIQAKFGSFSESSAFAHPNSLPLSEETKSTQSILGASLRHGSGSPRTSSRSTPVIPRPLIPPFPGMPALTTYSALPNLTLNALKRSQQHHHTHSPATSKASRLPNSLKSSMKKLEQFGLNKPRSNSIPNFQSSSRFSNFFHSQDPRATEGTQSDAYSGVRSLAPPSSVDLPSSHALLTGGDLHSDDSTDHERPLSHPTYLTSVSGSL